MLKINLNSRGFTLLELLIVIGIIGILTTVFVNTATINLKRGRDARRQSDLSEIQSAIETYHADCNKYPVSLSSPLKGNGSTSSCLASNTYLNSVPSDPQNPTNKYVYTSNGTTYQICSTEEAPKSGVAAVTCNGSTTSCGGTCYYQVTNP